jgi:hypothetical protein
MLMGVNTFSVIKAFGGALLRCIIATYFDFGFKSWSRLGGENSDQSVRKKQFLFYIIASIHEIAIVQTSHNPPKL